MSKTYVELVDEIALHVIKVQLSEAENLGGLTDSELFDAGKQLGSIAYNLAAGAVSARSAFMQPKGTTRLTQE